MTTERPAVGRPRAMSGTIPSMEVSHEQLKDNTIIIGEVIYPKHCNTDINIFIDVLVFGASGDLAKKKV